MNRRLSLSLPATWLVFLGSWTGVLTLNTGFEACAANAQVPQTAAARTPPGKPADIAFAVPTNPPALVTTNGSGVLLEQAGDATAIAADTTVLATLDFSQQLTNHLASTGYVWNALGAATNAARLLYVDALGGDDATARAGNSLQAWRTFGLAVSNAQPGDTVMVRSGVYDEPGVVAVPVGVSVVGEPGNLLRLHYDCDGGSTEGALVLQGDSTFQRMNVQLVQDYAWILIGGLGSPPTNILLDGCSIEGKSDIFMFFLGLDGETEHDLPASITIRNCQLKSGWDVFACLWWATTNAVVRIENCAVEFDTRTYKGSTSSGGLGAFWRCVNAGGIVSLSGIQLRWVHAQRAGFGMASLPAVPGSSPRMNLTGVWCDYSGADLVEVTPEDFIREWDRAGGEAFASAVSWAATGLNVTWATGTNFGLFAGNATLLTNASPALATNAPAASDGWVLSKAGDRLRWTIPGGTLPAVGPAGWSLTTSNGIANWSRNAGNFTNLPAGELSGSLPPSLTNFARLSVTNDLDIGGAARGASGRFSVSNASGASGVSITAGSMQASGDLRASNIWSLAAVTVTPGTSLTTTRQAGRIRLAPGNRTFFIIHPTVTASSAVSATINTRNAGVASVIAEPSTGVIRLEVNAPATAPCDIAWHILAP